MSEAELPPAAPPPRPWFQFSLQTLFLLFVVLATSMGLFGAWGAVIFVLTVGLAAYLNRFLSVQLVLALAALGMLSLFGVLASASGTPKWPANERDCMRNLSQIARALNLYAVANGLSFPPAYIADKNGKPMHSWRVLILPYLGEMSLYKKYDLTEPWDGPHNKKLLASRPSDYFCPSDPSNNSPGDTQTNYVAVVGSNAAWLGDKSRTRRELSGQAADTILIVEVTNSKINWTEPRDLSLDALKAALAGAAALTPSTYHGTQADLFFTYDPCPNALVAMADGRVRYLPPGVVTADCLPRMLEIGGCDPALIESLAGSYEPRRHFRWSNITALAVWLLSVGTLLARAVRNRKPR